MANTDFLVIPSDVLANAQVVKAATWQDAVKTYAQTEPSVPHVTCIPTSAVQRASVITVPVVNVTVTPE